ncbi:uncharacterized protein LTR77_002297 [Saxophila tyrrhenica]|uniref:Uncharacterized protein n=1 Tax=Saxophila tyrrhenica TaxID=1690608 RepID=A0AAV9PJX7_9PEZI|nr:hypothetical protein LTR77_002297 [Saxophila tyrrhenica]
MERIIKRLQDDFMAADRVWYRSHLFDQAPRYGTLPTEPEQIVLSLKNDFKTQAGELTNMVVYSSDKQVFMVSELVMGTLCPQLRERAVEYRTLDIEADRRACVVRMREGKEEVAQIVPSDAKTEVISTTKRMDDLTMCDMDGGGSEDWRVCYGSGGEAS